MIGEIGNLYHKGGWTPGGLQPSEFIRHLIKGHKAHYNDYPKRVEINAAQHKDWGIDQVDGVQVAPSLVVQRNNFWVVLRDGKDD